MFIASQWRCCHHSPRPNRVDRAGPSQRPRNISAPEGFNRSVALASMKEDLVHRLMTPAAPEVELAPEDFLRRPDHASELLSEAEGRRRASRSLDDAERREMQRQRVA